MQKLKVAFVVLFASGCEMAPLEEGALQYAVMGPDGGMAPDAGTTTTTTTDAGTTGPDGGTAAPSCPSTPPGSTFNLNFEQMTDYVHFGPATWAQGGTTQGTVRSLTFRGSAQINHTGELTVTEGFQCVNGSWKSITVSISGSTQTPTPYYEDGAVLADDISISLNGSVVDGAYRYNGSVTKDKKLKKFVTWDMRYCSRLGLEVRDHRQSIYGGGSSPSKKDDIHSEDRDGTHELYGYPCYRGRKVDTKTWEGAEQVLDRTADYVKDVRDQVVVETLDLSQTDHGEARTIAARLHMEPDGTETLRYEDSPLGWSPAVFTWRSGCLLNFQTLVGMGGEEVAAPFSAEQLADIQEKYGQIALILMQAMVTEFRLPFFPGFQVAGCGMSTSQPT